MFFSLNVYSIVYNKYIVIQKKYAKHFPPPYERISRCH